eukprot:TRINITY_DN14207_c0_g1_i1.p1 TRINITY_DN14207_c0_g1~~TRINITY_DN14207_c0_g1_i1.p1  ORF type:complete len:1251 (+),score=164.76 TRINITY_DN14207_c0_g1_i1:107-3859(+)
MFSVAQLAAVSLREGSLREEHCQALPSFGAPTSVVIASTRTRYEQERRSPRRGYVLRTAFAAVRNDVLCAACLLLLRGVGNAFVMPLLLKFVVTAIIDRDSERVMLLLGAILVERVVGAFLEYWGFKTTMTAVPTTGATAISCLVVDKAATPGMVGMAKAGVDPSAIVGRELVVLHEKLGQMMASGFVAVPTFVAGCVSLWVILGWSTIFGIVWMLLTIRLAVLAQHHAKKADEAMSIEATERLRVLNNCLGAAKAIKYFAWEPQFAEALNAGRARECVKLRKRAFFIATAIAVGKLTPVTASLVSFLCFALVGNRMDASDMFAANTVFMTLRFAVGAMSFLSETYKNVKLTTDRVEKLLDLDELPPRSIIHEGSMVLADVSDLGITFREATVSVRVNGALTLGMPGKMTAICGYVGSGKSVLLSSLLGVIEGDEVKGTTRAVARTGWCPQKPFVICGTIRDNILLGRPLDQARLARCLADACFGRDLELLRDGLDEIVGERGTTLSGGQQARLGLARALYADPSLLLLDDPLAAVDPSVGRAMFRAIRLRCAVESAGAVSAPGAVVVLNQLSLLPNFDNIVFMKCGCIVATGSFDEVSKNSEFMSFLEGIDMQTMALDVREDSLLAEDEARLVKCSMIEEPKGNVLTKTSTDQVSKAEAVASGFISWAVWRSYFFAPGRLFFFFVLFVYAVLYLTLGLRDWWLAVWADEDGGSEPFYMLLFTAFSAIHMLVVVFAVTSLSTFVSRAGLLLHGDCVSRLLRAPTSYFDDTPVGRITSRLGSDLALVDSSIPAMLDISLTFSFMVVFLSVVIVANMPFVAIVFFVALVVSFPVVRGVAIFRQDTKRHSNNAMAPILSNLSELCRGAALVNSLGCRDFFVSRHQTLIDRWGLLSNASMYTTPLMQSFVHSTHTMVLALIGAVCIVRIRDLGTSSGVVAMYFSYASLWGIFAMYSMNAFFGLLTSGASLERLVELKIGALPQEAAWRFKEDPQQCDWPSRGEIDFDNVALRYREGYPRALDGFSLKVMPREKIGIVGRTGAGKSSITNVLFRIVDCEGGAVCIDGVDAARVGLHALRESLSMIPQEPLVMDGSVRYNLDPFQRHEDDRLSEALSIAGLGPAVNLDTLAGGSSLSAGQRQLLTFARTLLQNTRIVVMDEPTASVDMQTDRAVQNVVRNVFKNRTMLTIAHRLDTVITCDRIAVMDAGRITELGPPAELLQDSSSLLSKLQAASTKGSLDEMPESLKDSVTCVSL